WIVNVFHQTTLRLLGGFLALASAYGAHAAAPDGNLNTLTASQAETSEPLPAEEALWITPSSHDFGVVGPRDFKAYTFTVNASRSVQLMSGSAWLIGTDSEFYRISGTCFQGRVTAPGNPCSVQLMFKPKAAGLRENSEVAIRFRSSGPEPSVGAV